ncbi:MAG TPA: antibiotic biosynthesis monooxygenase [Burkholderiales bacterium]|jgi:quinol monooxygenase YgiN|nr:antibiotic biosynthesis monooxygenase [Burkholderiales bacterium]
MRFHWFAVLIGLFALHALAQAPAPASPPPPVPADVSPLYVVTYVELRPNAASEGAVILKSWRDAQRKAEGNLRAEVVHHSTRPGQFVVLAAWQNKAAFDGHAAAGQGYRDKLAALRNSPADDRFHNGLSVGKLEPARGALVVVTHVDVIPPQRENAVVALKALGEANRAAQGNVRYEIVQQTNRPNHFTVVETWRSRQAFDANSMSAHQREFRDKLAQMTGALYDERLYESID